MNTIDRRCKHKRPEIRELSSVDKLIIDAMLLKWFFKIYCLPRKPRMLSVPSWAIESRLRLQRRLLEDHKRRAVKVIP